MPASRFRILILLAVTLLPLPALTQPDLLRQGLALMSASRPLEAEQVLKSVPESHPDYRSARILLGFLFLRRSALAEAEQAFRWVLQANPENAPARLGLGMTLVQKGLARQAALEFEKILGDPSLGSRAQVQWIASLFLMGKDEEALRAGQELAARFPRIPECQNMLGYILRARGRSREALQAFRRSIELEPRSLSTLMSLISLARDQQDWAQALVWTERALEVDANHPLLYQELATICRHLGQTEEAESARREAEKTYEAELLYIRAARSKALGRVEEAKQLLRKCLEKNPRLSKAWEDLGELLRQATQLEEARRAFLMAVESDPESSRAYLGLAAALQSLGKQAEAFRYYQKATGRGLYAPDLFTGMAATLLDQGKTQEAAAAMLRAIRQLPDNPDLLSYLGYLQEAAGKHKEAEETYDDALRINPLQVDALIGKAQLSLSHDRIPEASALFRLAVDLKPAKSEAWQGLIQAQRRAGNTEAAEASCRACLEQLPQDPQCREQLASLRLDAGDYKESAAQFQHLLRSGIASKEIIDSLAFSLMRVGDHPQAIGLFESSLKRYGKDAWVYANLGYLYRCGGDLASAALNYRRARQLAPADPEICHSLGLVLHLSRDYLSAIEPFQAAIHKKPGWGLAHLNLAMTYWNLGQYAMALSHARLAQENGVQEAGPVVRALAESLSIAAPRMVTVQRPRR